MPQLDNYLVSLGVKGQNIVLAQMEKIRKTGQAISKSKTVVDLMSKTGKGAATAGAPEKLIEQEKKENDKVKKTHQHEAEDEKKTGSKLKDTVGKFGQGVQNFAGAASSLDPTSTISGITSALGTTLSGISVLGVSLGRVPEGIAAIANSTLAMAKNSVDMAKQSTAAFYALTTRNVTAEHYGGKVGGQGQLSRNERAMFIDAVSGSMGKIQQPLAEQINKLIGKKDTRALARVGAGDWESTGTDKGWMLGQMMSGVQGLPPSIKQRFQASLLSKNSDLIQDMTPGQAGTQRSAATFANMEEDQTGALAAEAKKQEGAVVGMMTGMNKLQIKLFDTGLTFASAIDSTISTLAGLEGAIKKVGKVVDQITDSAARMGFSSAKDLRSTAGGTPRAGK
jgi:hypothetical protein